MKTALFIFNGNKWKSEIAENLWDELNAEKHTEEKMI